MNRLSAAFVLVGLSALPLIAQESTESTSPSFREKGFTPTPKNQIQAFSVSSYPQGDATDAEQYMLELINRARANPGAEASRLGISLNHGLPPGTISDTPKQPLAFNEFLISAARSHSQWMLDNNTFSHTGQGGSTATQRVEAAGFPLTGSWTTGENIVWRGSSGAINVSAFTKTIYEDLFKSDDHRENILLPIFDHVGLGVISGKFRDKGTNWNALMGTQEFATSGGSPSPEGPFVTGVVYSDTNSNNFYEPGEGLGGVNVSLLPGGSSTTTTASGGYAIPLGTTSGSLIVTFSGGALPTPQQVSTTVVPGVSVKVDAKSTSSPLPLRRRAIQSPRRRLTPTAEPSGVLSG